MLHAHATLASSTRAGIIAELLAAGGSTAVERLTETE